MRAANALASLASEKAQASLRICAGKYSGVYDTLASMSVEQQTLKRSADSPELSLFDFAISTKRSCILILNEFKYDFTFQAFILRRYFAKAS